MKWISLLATAALVVVTTGCGKDKTTRVTGEGDKVLELTVPGTTSIKQGTEEKITVKIKREKFDDAVTVEVTNLPDGVKVKEGPMKIEKGATEATYFLVADAKAAVQKGHQAKVTVSGGGMKAGPKDFTVNVEEKK